jgi:large subunit ribosomal protein L27
MGRDHTLHAKVDGEVYFRRKAKNRMFVNIAPIVDETLAAPAKPVKKAAAPKAKAAPKAPAKPAVEAQPLAAMAAPAAPAVEAKPAKATKITLPSGKKLKQDDLKMVEGIGPKIEGLLHDAGITTWKQLAEAPEAEVKAILTAAGPRYQMHQPKTWATQARLAHEANWATLERYQDWLDGGREIEGETFDFNA